jgi:hypothetical protein
MKLFSFFKLVLRLTVVSLVALYLQIFLAINNSSVLLYLQNGIHTLSRKAFNQFDTSSAVQVTYNFLNGSNILVHTLFIIAAYFSAHLLGVLYRWVTISK